ncbi:anti-sigma factor domain-containing protein [Deinococcus alpinitundrae]|uniref:anti-sigma factor n=1 Tax=Deinococcus alpinitundrae TaxID=468913 RepID=UPI00137B6135|nr:anti-sigma factor [Deinococcus alpinitundrae]
MTRPDDHPTDLLPDYVLASLDPDQDMTVDTHLQSCADCRVEVARLREALFSLADDLPAVAVPEGPWKAIQAQRSRSSAQAPPSSAPSVSVRLRRFPVWPLAAAIALIMAVGGYTLVSTRSGVQTAQASARHWLAQGARLLTLTSKNGQPYGSMYVRPDGRALLVLNKKAAPGQVYQAWGRQASGPRAGVPTSLGLTGGTVMEVSWRGYDSVGVSIEPAGGSLAPTHPLGRTRLPES